MNKPDVAVVPPVEASSSASVVGPETLERFICFVCLCCIKRRRIIGSVVWVGVSDVFCRTSESTSDAVTWSSSCFVYPVGENPSGKVAPL